MFTLFHLIRLISVLAGLVWGWSYGRHLFGIAGAILGAILGFVIGNIIGYIPEWLALKTIVPKLSKMSEEELRRKISDPECYIPNLILLELNSRGLNIDNHLADVLNMLRSDDSSRRGFGWAALTSAFPDATKEVKTYDINDSIEKCIQNTLSLEKYVQH
jgi:hypothetical protein